MIDQFILVEDNFVPKDWCEEAIAICDHQLAMGIGVDRSSQLNNKMLIDDVSVSHYAPLQHLTAEFVQRFWGGPYLRYAKEFSQLKESGPHNIYSIKVQKTLPGQGYHVWHYESSDREGCPRLLAFMLYLNDVEVGGETEFLYQAKRIKPTTGTVVIFPAAFTHTHRGNPPLSGAKYIVTGWIEF